MKALHLLHPSATHDWSRGAIKAFRLDTLAAVPLNLVKFNGSSDSSIKDGLNGPGVMGRCTFLMC